MKREDLMKFAPMPTKTYDSLMAAARSVEEEKVVKKKIPWSIVLVFVLLCIAMVAFAAASNWDLFALMTRKNDDGTTSVNHAMLEHVQPLGMVFDGDTLRVQVIDTVFDGVTFSMSCTIENKSDKVVYLLSSDLINGWPSSGGMGYNLDDLLVFPGETVSGGMSARVNHTIYGENLGILNECDVLLYFNAYTTEAIFTQTPYVGTNTNGARDGYKEDVSEMIQQNAIPIYDKRKIDYALLEGFGEVSQEEMLLSTGLFKVAERLTASFSIPRSGGQVWTALHDGIPLEIDSGNYRLQIFMADMTLDTVSIGMKFIFNSRETADEFREYMYPGSDDLALGVVCIDETGSHDWYSLSSWNGDGSGVQSHADGTYTIGANIELGQLTQNPMSISLLPRLYHVGDHDPEEALLLESITLLFEPKKSY